MPGQAGEAREHDEGSAGSRDDHRPSFLLGQLLRPVHEAGDVGVNAEGGRARGVLRGSGVLADADPRRQPSSSSTVGPSPGANPVRLGAPEPGLAVGDLDTRAVHPQHRDGTGAVSIEPTGTQQLPDVSGRGLDPLARRLRLRGIPEDLGAGG